MRTKIFSGVLNKKFKLFAFGFAACIMLSIFYSCEVGLGPAVDTQPPSITIEKPEVDMVIRNQFVMSGAWSDDGTIDDVYVILKRTDGNPVDGNRQAGSDKTELKVQGTFEKDLLLKGVGTWKVEIDPSDEENLILDGTYQATVYIKDKGSHTTTQSTTFTIDNTAPVLILSKPNSKPGDKTMSAYGQRLFLEGSVADATKDTWIEINFYLDEECTQPLTTLETQLISPTDVNSNNAKLASFNEDLTVDLAQEYFDIYKDEAGNDKIGKAGKSKVYATITVYDTAETCTEEETEQEMSLDGKKIKGNASQTFYISKDLANSITKSQEAGGYGFAPIDLYNLFNGTYDLKNSSRSVDSTEVTEELEELQRNKTVFTINPENSPYFTVSGLKTLSDQNLNVSDNGYFVINGAQSLEISVFMGSDSIELVDDDDFYVYLLKCDAYGVPYEDSEPIPLYSKSDEIGTGADKKTYYEIGGKEDHKTTSGAYVFTVPVTKSLKVNPDLEGADAYEAIPIEFSQNYLICVSGKDNEDNPIEAYDTGYAFHFTSSGSAPVMNLENPRENTVFLKKGANITFEGTVKTEEGLPQVSIWNGDYRIADVPITNPVEGELNNFSYTINAEEFEEGDITSSNIYSISVKVSADGNTDNVTEVQRSVWYDIDGPKITVNSIQPVVTANGKTNNINGKLAAKGTIIDGFDQFGSASWRILQNGEPVEGLSGTLSSSFEFEVDTTKLQDKKEAVIEIEAYDRSGNKSVWSGDSAEDGDVVWGGEYYVDQSTDKPVIKSTSESLIITSDGNDEDILTEGKNLFVRGGTLVLNVEDDDAVKTAIVKLAKKQENGTFEQATSADTTGTLYKEYNNPSAISHSLPTTVGIYRATVTVYDKFYKPDGSTPNNFNECEFILRITGTGPDVTVSTEKDYISTLNHAGSNKITFTITDDGNGPYKLYKDNNVLFDGARKNSPIEYTIPFDANYAPENPEEIIFRIEDTNQGFTEKIYKPKFDNGLPEVAISATPTTSLTEESSYLFKGTMSDTPSGIDVVKIKFTDSTDSSATSAWLDCIAGSQSWNYEAVWAGSDLSAVFATEGQKIVTVKAIDNAGNEKTVSDTFVYDKLKPVIESVTGPADTNGTDVTFQVTVKDTNPESLSVVVKQNGDAVSPAPNLTISSLTGSGTTYTGTVVVPFSTGITQDGSYSIEFVANDENEKTSASKTVEITRDSEKPVVSNVKLIEETGSKDAYNNDGKYYINNTRSTYKISGIATDNVGVDSVALVITNKDNTSVKLTPQRSGALGQWSFTGINMSSWVSSGATADLIVKDKAGNQAQTNVALDIVFDTEAPAAEHQIDDSHKDLVFRIGDYENDAHESDVGGKYSNGTYGSALTMQIRGNFPDNEGGSGINKIYYKVFEDEVTIDENRENGAVISGKIYFQTLDDLKDYVIANKTDSFSPLTATETRHVEYNITPAANVEETVDRLGGGTLTNGYNLTSKGFVQYRKSITSNYKTTIKGFQEGRNYLVIVAEDNVGNSSVDHAEVPTPEDPSVTAIYPCYSLNVDITAPTIPTKQSGTVYTNLAGSTPVFISGTVSDKSSSEDGSSGLNKIVFTSDQTDGTVTVYSSAFADVDASENTNNDPTLKNWTANIKSLLNADGTAIISAKVSDNAGYETSVPVANVMVDRTAPSVVINSPSFNAKTGTTVNISGTVNDGTGSGVDSTKPMVLYYTTNTTVGGTNLTQAPAANTDASAGWVQLATITPETNGSWSYELDASTITTNGDNNIRFFTVSATDKAGNGNTGFAEAVRITVDRKAPVSSEFKVDETNGSALGSDIAVWFKNTTVNLNGTFADQGGSGVSAVKYQVKKGAAEYGAAQNVASDGSFSFNIKDLADGTNKVKIWAVDASGNESSAVEYTVMVDAGIPSISTSYSGVINANASACPINLTVVDQGSSGINKVQLKVGNNDPVDCDLIDASSGLYSKDVMSILPQGTVSVTAIATDNAGNSTSSVIANVMLDTEGPVVVINSPSANAKIGSEITVSGTADDRTGAGVDTTKNLILYYTTNEATGNVTTAPTSITPSDDASAGWKAYNTTQILGEDGQNWSCTVDVTTLGTLFPEDADTPVWFTVMATDKSGDGNKGYAIPRKAIVDRIKPTFDDSNSGINGTNGVSAVNAKWFDATTLNIFGKFVDTTNGSGVKTIYYKLGSADPVSIATTNGTYNTNIQGFAAGSNTLKIWAEDAAGNISNEITYTVKIDTVAPELAESGIGTTGKTTNAGFTLSGKVWDANQLSRIEIKLGSQTWTSGTSSNVSLTAATEEPASANWSATFVTGTSNNSATNYIADGTKEFTITAYDVAGQTKQLTRTVVVDTQVPVIGTVTVDETGGVTIDGNIWYTTTSVPVTVEVTDEGVSGVSKAEYATQAGNDATWTPLSYDGTNYTGTANFAGNGSQTLRLRATDVAGNVSTESTVSVNIDTSAPDLTALYYRKGSEAPQAVSSPVYINSGTQITVYGNYKDEQSGVNELVFKLADAEITPTVTYSTTAIGNSAPSDSSYGTYASITDKKAIRSWKAVYTPAASGRLTAEGPNRTNTKTSVNVFDITIDTNVPALSNVKFTEVKTGIPNKDAYTDGSSYYVNSTGKTFTVSGIATDDIGVDSVSLSITGSSSTITPTRSGTLGQWTFTGIDLSSWSGNGTATVTVTDKAGNETTQTLNIVFDTTVPASDTISIQGQTENLTTRWYVSESLSLSGSYTDSGSGVAKVYYKLGISGTERSLTPTYNSTTQAYDYSTTIDFTGVSDKKLYIKAEDNAGNLMSDYTQYSLNIDTAAPTVTSNHTETETTNGSGAVNVSVNVTETGSGLQSVKLSRSGTDTQVTMTAGSGNTYTADASSLLAGLNSGTVTITATATDSAGNQTSIAAVSVMIDKAAPSLRITTPSANAKTGTGITVTGTADDGNGVGIDTTAGLTLYYTKNSTLGGVTTAPASITAGTDATTGWVAYATAPSLTGSDWTCTVDTTSFTTNNANTDVYFTVSAKDIAGSGNTGYAVPRKVSVDRKAPVSSTLYIDETAGSSLGTGTTVWFNNTTVNLNGTFTDLQGSGITAVKYQVKKAGDAAYGTEQTVASDGSYSANIKDLTAGTNTIKVWAVDAVGNESSAEEYTVKVDIVPPELAESGIGTTGKTTNAGFTLSGKVWDANQLSRIEIKSGSQTWTSGTSSNVSLTAATEEPASANWSASFVTGTGNSSAANYIADGTKEFTITAYDVAGQTKQVTRTVTVDTQVPVIGTVTVDETGGVTIGEEIWYTTTSVPVTVAVTDAGVSGVSKAEYATQTGNGATWTPLSYDGTNYTGTANFAGNGSQTLRLRATDVAGNVSTESTVSVNIDTSAPDLTALYYKKGTGAAEAVSSPVYLTDGTQITVYGNYGDGQSGVNALTFKMGDTTVTPTVSYSTTAIGNSAPSDSSFGTYASITDKTTIKSWKVVYTPTASGRFTAEGSNRTNTTASASVFDITIDTAVPSISNVKLTEVKTGVANKDAYKNGSSYYVNSTGKTFTVSGIATDDIGVDSVSLSITGSSSTITPTRSGTLGQWTFTGIDLSSWSGTGTATVTVTDKAGNVTTESFSIVFDSAAPVSNTILINNESTNITTRWYDSESLALSGSYNDTVSGVARVYYKLGSTGTEKSLTPVYNETDDTYEYSTTIDFTGITDRKLYIKAEDNAGNVMSDYTQYSLNIDIVSPELTETGIGTTGKTTNAGFTLTGKAWDANELSRIEIKLGSQTWVSGTDSNVSLIKRTSDPGENQTNWTATFVTGSANSTEANYVADGTKEFTVTAYDVAGLPKQVTRTVVVDTVLPEADEPSITSTGNTVSGKTWFNSSFINIKVENVKDTGGTGISKVEYSKDNGSSWSQMSGSGTTYTATVNCTNQGANIIQVRVTDAAENQTVAGSVTAYVDTKEPSLENSYAKYLTGDYEAVSELLINGDNGYELKISAKDEEGGTGANAGNNSGIASVQYSYGSYTINGTKSGNDWLITVPKTGNGTNNYSDTGSNKIYVIIKDNAGNEVKERVLTVTKDETPPTVDIKSFTRAGSKTTVSGSELDDVNGTITISGLADDTNRFGSVKLEYQKAGDSTWTEIPMTSQTSWTTTLNTKATGFSDKAKYTIKATATDAAGNTAEDTQVVYVNQDSDRPVITVTNMTIATVANETSYLKRTSRLEGTVSDDDGNVSKLEYSTNGSTWTEATLEYGTAWSIANLTEGDNKLYFRVTDSVNATPFATAVEDSNATSEAAGQPKIKDNSNTYVTHTQGSLALNFMVVTKQPDVDEKQYQVYNSSTDSWETRENLGTLGGVYTKFKISLKAKAEASISKVEAKYATDDYDINFTCDDTNHSNNAYHTWRTGEINLVNSKTEVKIKVSDASSTIDPMTLEQTITYAVDDTAPIISIKEPSSTAGVKETMQFDMSEAATSYYAVTLSSVTADATTGAPSTEPAWTEILDTSNGLTRYVFFDDDSTEQDKTDRFALYLTEATQAKPNRLGIITLAEIEATSDPYETITPVKFWVKAVDSCGNVGYSSKVVNVDPQGNRPTVTLNSPVNVLNQSGQSVPPTLGGTIRIDGNVADDKGAKFVWLQITRSWTVTNNGSTTSVNKPFNGEALKYLVEKGYTIGDMTSNADVAAATINALANNATVSDYAIKVPVTGTAWNLSINGNQEFNEAAEVDIVFTIYATDADTDNQGVAHIHRSAPITQSIKIDSRTPYINTSELYLVKYNGNTEVARKEYKEGEDVDGIWYLQGKIKDDDSGLKTVSYKKNNAATYTKVITAYGGNVDSVDGDTHFYFKKVAHTDAATKYDYDFSVPLGSSAADQVGTDSIQIYAVENTDQNLNTEPTFRVTYDNKAPEFNTDSNNAFVKLSQEVYNSSGFYTFGAIASEDKVGNVSQSGVERIAFYFTRDLNYGLNQLDSTVYTAHSGTTTKDLFDVMIYHSNIDADDVASGNMIVGYNSSLTLSDGLYWRTHAGSVSGKTFTYTGDADPNIHAGGLVKINGVIYKIESVSGQTVNLPSNIDSAASAQFAICNVIDNSGEKNGSSTSSTHGYGFGYYPSRVTDDGDLITESFNQQGTEWIFDASINSRNLPDGPITLHMVAFDKAGNVTTTPFTMTGTVKNNAPRIAGLILGTDENGNNQIDTSELVSTYSGKFSRGYDTAGNEMHDVSFPVVAEGGTQTALLTVKGLTVVKPEIIGGNGAISYSYKVKTDGTWGDEVSGGNLKNSAGNNISGTTDDVVTGTITLPVSAFIGTTNGSDTNAIPDGTLSEFKFIFGDSTPGTSQNDTTGKNSASMSVILDVALRETTKAKNWILPFYWKSATDNSLFNQSKDNGHIELAADWVTTSSFTGTTGEYDADPKVSGKIKIEGIAQDDTLLREIKVQFGKSMGGLGTTDTTIATYNAAGGNWTVTPLTNNAISSSTGWASAVQQATYQDLKDVGIISAIPDDKEATSKVPYSSQDYGHVVHWILYLNTEKVNGVAATDVTVTATATDRGKPTWNATASATAYATNGAETTVTANNSGYSGAVSADGSVADLTGKYRVDVVPYVTEIKRNSTYNTNRARSGAVSLLRGEETNLVKGFNLGNTTNTSINIAANKTGTESAIAMEDVALSGSDLSFTVKTTAKTGYLHVVVNNIAALNNLNSYVDYNTETYAKAYDHNTLTDDRYVHIWRVSTADTFKGSKNANYPAMSSDSNGVLYASFTNYGQAKSYYSKAFVDAKNVSFETSATATGDVTTVYSGYDPSEDTDISVGPDDKVNVFYNANYHGGQSYSWGDGVTDLGRNYNPRYAYFSNTYPTWAGGIYVYDPIAPNVTYNSNSTGSPHRLYRFELFTYDNELNQFKNMRVNRTYLSDTAYVNVVYYDRLTGAIKYSYATGNIDTSTSGLPWIVIDGDSDKTDTEAKVLDYNANTTRPGNSTFEFAGDWNPFILADNCYTAGGVTRSDGTGESVALTATSNGAPVILYMDAATGQPRIAFANSRSPNSSDNWIVQGVFDEGDENYATASDYMSCVVDSSDNLHIAFQNTKGQLVYGKGTKNATTGLYEFGASQVLDDSGMHIDMTMNGNVPYISYLSRVNSYDGMKIAFLDPNFDENNDGTADGGWETLTAAMDQKVTNVRTCIEPNARAADYATTNTKYTVAIGYHPGSDYRAAFYVGQ